MSSEARLPQERAPEVEGAIHAFSAVLEDLQSGHAQLAERAQRVEAELCRANESLEAKVQELDAVKRDLEAILSCLPTGVVVRSADGKVERANEAALSILDCTAEQLSGNTGWAGLEGPEATGEVHDFVRADGTRFALSNRYSPVRLDNGDEVGSVEILDDRTALQAMTRRVHGLDKMAALGTMAGGIAHEIRNPLNAVKGFAALLEPRLPADSQEAHWSRRIQDGVDECNAIITSMLTFADPERLALETVDVRELVEDSLGAFAREPRQPRAHEITTDVEDMSLAGDRIKLRQALRNLVANALDAQPEGGEIHVEVSRTDGGACFRVTDSGPGIPPDLADRVADPFFTTHADGTGLGLALVYTIARLHGGSLEVATEPAPQGGADVRLTIPLSPGS